MIYGDLDKSIPSAFEAEEAGALPASPAHRPLAVKNLQSFKKPEDNAHTNGLYPNTVFPILIFLVPPDKKY